MKYNDLRKLPDGQKIKVLRPNDEVLGTITQKEDHILFTSDATVRYVNGVEIESKTELRLVNDCYIYVPEHSKEYLRHLKWNEVKEFRKQKENEGVKTLYGVFDSDLDSLNKLTMFNSVEWTLANNVAIFLDSEMIDTVKKSFSEHYDKIHRISQMLRLEINSYKELENYDVEERWNYYSKSFF